MSTPVLVTAHVEAAAAPLIGAAGQEEDALERRPFLSRLLARDDCRWCLGVLLVLLFIFVAILLLFRYTTFPMSG
jgi:hypothetical protein